MQCILSNQTISPGDEAYIIALVSGVRPLDATRAVTHLGDDGSPVGQGLRQTDSLHQPDALWRLAAPFMRASNTAGLPEVLLDPRRVFVVENNLPLIALLRTVYERAVPVIGGPDRFKNGPLDVRAKFAEIAPNLADYFKQPNSSGLAELEVIATKTPAAVKVQALNAWGLVWAEARLGRIQLRGDAGEVSPLTFGVAHGRVVDLLIGGQASDLLAKIVAGPKPGKVRLSLMSAVGFSGFDLLASELSVAPVEAFGLAYCSGIEYGPLLKKYAWGDEKFAHAVKPLVMQAVVWQRMLDLEIKFGPSVKRDTSYGNEVGDEYAQFIAKAQAAVSAPTEEDWQIMAEDAGELPTTDLASLLAQHAKLLRFVKGLAQQSEVDCADQDTQEEAIELLAKIGIRTEAADPDDQYSRPTIR